MEAQAFIQQKNYGILSASGFNPLLYMYALSAPATPT